MSSPTCRHARRLVPVLALAIGLGCSPDAQGPSAPDNPATAALVADPALGLIRFRQVSSSARHTCVVTVGDRAFCWGFNFSGELGIGTTGPEQCGVWPCSTHPVAVLGGHRFRQVSVGWDFSCGVTTDDRAYCWGRNGEGQLGDGTLTDQLAPVAVAGGLHFRVVEAGSNHACGITTADAAYCWGTNFNGQLGNGTSTARPKPVAVAGGHKFRLIAAGAAFTCGVRTDNRGFCWGNNGNGQIGNGTSGNTVLLPAAVAGGLRFKRIDLGAAHTCAVIVAGKAYCWGFGGQGIRGDGKVTNVRRTPAPVSGNRSYESISAGQDHTCGVTPAGKGFCWGFNPDGRLGVATPNPSLVPVAVSGGLLLRQVTAGRQHSCAISADRLLFCWGANDVGQLGDGTTADRATPGLVAPPT